MIICAHTYIQISIYQFNVIIIISDDGIKLNIRANSIWYKKLDRELYGGRNIIMKILIQETLTSKQ